MNVQKERRLLKDAYGESRWWSSKVDKMTDKQVIAVLMRLKLTGKIKV
jgi:hypothetical protein